MCLFLHHILHDFFYNCCHSISLSLLLSYKSYKLFHLKHEIRDVKFYPISSSFKKTLSTALRFAASNEQIVTGRLTWKLLALWWFNPMRFTNYTSVKCTMTVGGAVFQRTTPDWLDAEYLIVKSIYCRWISWQLNAKTQFLGTRDFLSRLRCLLYILCLLNIRRRLESNFFPTFHLNFQNPTFWYFEQST